VRKYKSVLKASLSVICVVILLRETGPDSLRLIYDKTDLCVIAAVMALLATILLLQAVRWWLIGTKLGLTWKLSTSISLTFVGAFFNQILPSSSGGDVVRVWKLTRMGVPIRQATSSVVLDRLSALIAIAIIVSLGFSVLKAILQQHLLGIRVEVLSFALMISVVLAGSLWWLFRRFSALRQGRLVGAIIKLMQDALSIFRYPLLLFSSSAISIVAQITVGYVVWRLALGFGAKLDFVEFSLLWPFVLISSMIPISIAGWGVREGTMVVAFGILGNSPDIALATSIAFGIVMILVSLPGGVIWAASGFKGAIKMKDVGGVGQ
jgi:glycosyltransferase 2 family protein